MTRTTATARIALSIIFASAEAIAGAETDAQRPTTVTVRAQAESFLTARLPFWQERLNLSDWKITIVMTRRADLKSGTLGGIRWDKPRKAASMHVLDPLDYDTSTESMLKDMEFTLVHELIHLELASLPRSEASRKTEEVAVNNLTRALLTAVGQE